MTWVAGDTSDARLHWKKPRCWADEVAHYQIVRAPGICVYDWIPGRDLNAPGFPTILISSLNPASLNQVEVIATVESGVLHYMDDDRLAPCQKLLMSNVFNENSVLGTMTLIGALPLR